MGAAVCNKISEGGDIPLYSVKETVGAGNPLEEHTEERISPAFEGLQTGALGYFPKKMIPMET